MTYENESLPNARPRIVWTHFVLMRLRKIAEREIYEIISESSGRNSTVRSWWETSWLRWISENVLVRRQSCFIDFALYCFLPLRYSILAFDRSNRGDWWERCEIKLSAFIFRQCFFSLRAQHLLPVSDYGSWATWHSQWRFKFAPSNHPLAHFKQLNDKYFLARDYV